VFQPMLVHVFMVIAAAIVGRHFRFALC